MTWSCVRTADGSDWNCAQQQVRGGVSVGPAQGTSAAAAGAGSASAGPPATASSPRPTLEIQPNPHPPKTAETRKSPGRQLPGLQDSVTAAAVPPTTAPGLRAERPARPAPEPEPAMARWDDADPPQVAAKPPVAVAEGPANGTRTAVKTRPDRNADPKATPGPATADGSAIAETAVVAGAVARQAGAAEDEPREIPAVTARQDSGEAFATSYTVQLGAFDSVEKARAFIGRQDLAGLEVEAVERGGKTYQTVVFGTFTTAREATAAWGREAAGRGLDHWVRPRAK